MMGTRQELNIKVVKKMCSGNGLRLLTAGVLSAVFLMAGPDVVFAGGGELTFADAEGEGREINSSAIVTFLAFIALTLGITVFAARRTHSTSDFLAAGGRISGYQNGLALAGDFMSAAAILGTTGIAYLYGVDAVIIVTGSTIGISMLLFLMVERLRNLGKYTYTDALAFRLRQRPIRIVAAVSTLTISLCYLTAQMVGAGTLVEALFQIPYGYAVSLTGGLMIVYVALGGMIATTWVQITKAVLLLVGTAILFFGVLYAFDFNLNTLIESATAAYEGDRDVMLPGGFVTDPISALSLALAFIFGPVGMPHVLMRFFTVPDAKQARRSVVVTSACVGVFGIMIVIVGLGSIALLKENPQFFLDDGSLIGGSNMAVVHLAELVGGDMFLGFFSAVVFATILAVVSGLTLAAASAVSHDLFVHVFRNGKVSDQEQLRVSRLASFVIGGLAVALGLLFEGQNVGALAALAMTMAASANFPVLFLALNWSGLTTRGVVAGCVTGLVTTLAAIVLGPHVWVAVMGFEEAVVPYSYPTLFTLPAAFIAAWLASVFDTGPQAVAERAGFSHQFVRSEIGEINPVADEGKGLH